jgi:hypothetical protein
MEFKTVLKHGLPRSLARRLRRMSWISAAMLTIFGLMLAVTIRDVSGREGPITQWRVGTALWLVAVVEIPLLRALSRRVTRAITAYVALSAAILPSALALVDGSIRVAVQLFGAGSVLYLALSMLLGLATLPFLVRDRRRWFQKEMREGHLRRSLDRSTAVWDSQYDLDQIESSSALSRPGCLLRLIPWVGPAIGMTLYNLLGEATALRVLVSLLFLLGYGFTYLALGGGLVRFLEFRRLETELARPILLAQEPAAG